MFKSTKMMRLVICLCTVPRAFHFRRANKNEIQSSTEIIWIVREGFFWFPSARPSILMGSKIAPFSGRAISEEHLSERAVLWTAWVYVYGQVRAELWGAVERGVCFYELCPNLHQHIKHKVVCAELVTSIVRLLFMPKMLAFRRHKHRS